MTSLSNYNQNAETSYPNLKHIDIELTRDCNLDCIHCSTGLSMQGNELSVSYIEKVLQEAKTLGLEAVGFTGGEPFLRVEKLIGLVDFCKNEMSLPIHIHSNGTMISQKQAEWVKQSQVSITISLFGSEPRTHDAITKTTGSMKSTLCGLRNLVDVNADLAVFIVPMKSNYQEIPSLLKLVSEEGIRHVRILSLSPTGRAMCRYAELGLSDEQVSSLGRKLVKIQKETDLDLRAGFCTRLDFPELEVLKGHERCFAAENRIHIDAFGNVFPCTASSGRMIFSVGNLQRPNCSLTDIWQVSPLFQFLRKFHSSPPEKCKKCTRFQNCMSGCRVKMSYEYGDVTVANPQCGGPYLMRQRG